MDLNFIPQDPNAFGGQRKPRKKGTGTSKRRTVSQEGGVFIRRNVSVPKSYKVV